LHLIKGVRQKFAKQFPMDFSLESLRHVASFGQGKHGIQVLGYLCESSHKVYAIKSASSAHRSYLPLVDSLLRELQILSFIQMTAAGTSSEDKESKEALAISVSFPPSLEKMSFYRCFIIRSYGLIEKKQDLSSCPVILPPPVYLCLEAVLGGNLHQQLYHNTSSGTAFSLFQIRVYTRQLINVLLYFYSIGIIHRDLKLSNILINSFGHIKVCDFGSAIILDRDRDSVSSSSYVHRPHTYKQRTRTITGTLPFLSPEMIAFGLSRRNSAGEAKEDELEGYSYSVDWWSLGHLLYELVTKEILPLTWFLDGNDMMEGNEMDETNYQDPARNESSHLKDEQTKFNKYHHLLAQQVIENEEKGLHKISNSWNYEKFSHLPSLIEKSRNKRKSNQNHDFASFIPSSFDYYDPDEEHLLEQAHELISKLLIVSPKNRFICSHLTDCSSRNEVQKLLESKGFQKSLSHPFLIEELLFPNDLLSVSSEEEYISAILLKKKYQFEINEKIGFYDFFPEFNEKKSFDHTRVDVKNATKKEEKEDNDEINDEEQQLFKDF
jgi:serine/threonine protein kinase